MFVFFFLIFHGGSINLSHAKTINPDIVIALDGSGDFTSIQKAIDAAPSNSNRPTVIYIKRGIYNAEKLIINSDKKNIYFIGESREETIISYHIYDCATGKCPAYDAIKWTGNNIRTSATLTILGEGFRAENLTIRNTAGPVGQAQAITLQADKSVFINCDIKGYQDTIYLWTDGKRSYFENCLIVGRTDYIYGAGIAFFNSCEIRSWGGGWITAPSTPKLQPYGFVFSNCKITYAINSPRAGDDGAQIRLGRPWHEYPKVAWLNCNMTEKIHPQGWGDIWNMAYASSSTDLHLFEYSNTGVGADMTNRAKWAGLRSISSNEALNFSIHNVLSGVDNWNPVAVPQIVQKYNWTGMGNTADWLNPNNWSPISIPNSGEIANVNSDQIINAKGLFKADLSISGNTKLVINESATTTYLTAGGLNIYANGTDTLSGKIYTKDSIIFNISGKLVLKANLSGVHKIVKKGNGILLISGDNSSFSGKIEIQNGTIEAFSANSLGKGNIELFNNSRLIISDNAAFNPKSSLRVLSSSILELKKDLLTSEFFIDKKLQEIGQYDAISNPGLISSIGKVIVGRPALFTFIGGQGGNWDNPAHFSPALLPIAGETVICEREIETTATVFTADLRLKGNGQLRLRGNHKSSGTIFLEEGSSLRYNTAGAGMALNAPLKIVGNAEIIIESSNIGGSTMKLEGAISGTGRVKVINTGCGIINQGTLSLSGNNLNFNGIWDLTQYSTKYPNEKGYLTNLEGVGEYSLGASKIEIGLKNQLIINHILAAQPKLNLVIIDSAKVILNVMAITSEYILNDRNITKSTQSSVTNPSIYSGTGVLTIIGSMGTDKIGSITPLNISKHCILILGEKSNIQIYNVLGNLIFQYKNTSEIMLSDIKSGVYIIKYEVDGNSGVIKIGK